MSSTSRRRAVTTVIGLVALAGGLWGLRALTLTTHEPVDPDARLEVVVDAATRQAAAGQGPADLLAAKVAMCRVEVRFADVVEGPAPVDEAEGSRHRFRFVLQPSPGAADRRQLRGCLEDWNLDQAVVGVVSMRELGQR